MSAPVDVLRVLEFHANGFGNADNRGMKLSAKACGNIADELREARAAIAELIEAATRTVRYADSEPDGGEQVEVHRANIERMRAALSAVSPK